MTARAMFARRFLLAASVTACLSAGWEARAARAAGTARFIYITLAMDLEPERNRFTVTGTLVTEGGNRAVLHLGPSITVSALAIDGVAQDLSGIETLSFPLPSPEQHRIALTYSGRYETMGETETFLPPESGWWPGRRDGYVPYRLAVSVPKGQVAIAPGTVIGEKTSDDSYQVVVEAGYPAEPPSLFAGPYEITQMNRHGVRLRTYFHPQDAHLAEPYLKASARYIRSYEGLIDDYPFHGFHIVAAPIPVGYGFPNLTYVARKILPLPFMQTRSLAHEILHNWWGNGVYVNDRRGNWAEGLTTYLADYRLAAAESPEAAATMRLAWLRDYAALPENLDRPLTDFRGKGHDRDQVVGYNKTAFVFHMLKRRLGVAAFNRGLRRFWHANRFRAASWSDLQAAYSEAAALELSPFFTQWVTRKGAPRLKLGPVEITETETGWRLQSALHQEAPPFAVDVPARLIDAAGERLDFVIPMQGDRAGIDVALTARPVTLMIDPDSHVFRHLAPGEAPPIFRDLMLDPAARAVSGAAARSVAATVSERLIGKPPTGDALAEGPATGRPEGPLLIVGLTADLVQSGVQRPELPASGAAETPRARAWIIREEGRVVMVVEAATNEELIRFADRLPHYRSRSYVVVEEGGDVTSGVWPKSANHGLAWHGGSDPG